MDQGSTGSVDPTVSRSRKTNELTFLFNLYFYIRDRDLDLDLEPYLPNKSWGQILIRLTWIRKTMFFRASDVGRIISNILRINCIREKKSGLRLPNLYKKNCHYILGNNNILRKKFCPTSPKKKYFCCFHHHIRTNSDVSDLTNRNASIKCVY